MGSKRLWAGVYAAVTTKFTEGSELDLAATRKGLQALIKDGIDGLVVLGTCGETNALEPQEKRTVLDMATEIADGRVPVVAGVSELTTAHAMEFARQAQALEADALALLPALMDVLNEEELFEHYLRIASSTSLPIILYSNPPVWRTEISLALLDRLASVPNIVAIKESAPDSRRFADVIGAFGDRYALMTGRDDKILDDLTMGAKGWVSGLASAFPKEATALLRAHAAGRLEEARRLYRWFTPLLHLDSELDLVQSTKLAEQMVGRGSERVRMPRLPLRGARRSEVVAIVEKAIATRPGKPVAARL